MATDVEIYHRKHEAFLGSIKCPLRRLRHESIDINPRQYDPKNVARLIEIFKKQECRRLELGHHVPALISQEVYNTLAMVLNQGAEPAFVEPMEDITYLRGRHRIEAARKYLHPDDMWWIVDLYADCERSIPYLLYIDWTHRYGSSGPSGSGRASRGILERSELLRRRYLPTPAACHLGRQSRC